VTPVLLEEMKDVFNLFEHAIEESKKHNYLSAGEVVVITSGVPIGISGTTNMIKVEIVF
jgi:pyruvate kinase